MNFSSQRVLDFSEHLTLLTGALGSSISCGTRIVAGGRVQQFEAICLEGMIRRVLLLDALVQMHPSIV